MVLRRLAFTSRSRLVLLGAALWLAAAFYSSPVQAGAAPAPTTPCDPLLMDAMEERAWLEAQREIAQNQNIIIKPDSVLEYTCFDQFLNVLAGDTLPPQPAGPGTSWLFSEVACCGITPSPDILNRVLQWGVGRIMNTYITQNFSHRFMAGRYREDYPDPDRPNGNIADIGRVTGYAYGNSGPAYDCDRMRAVWDAAMCGDFADTTRADGQIGGNIAGNNIVRNGPSNGFFDFPYFINWDPRQVAYNRGTNRPGDYMFCASPVTAATNATRPDLQTAFNNRAVNYVLNPENTGVGNYQEDNISSNFARIWPFGPFGVCMNPIPTGITVTRIGAGAPAPYPDAFCPNPGCYYQPGGGGGLGTCSP